MMTCRRIRTKYKNSRIADLSMARLRLPILMATGETSLDGPVTFEHVCRPIRTLSRLGSEREL